IVVALQTMSDIVHRSDCVSSADKVRRCAMFRLWQPCRQGQKLCNVQIVAALQDKVRYSATFRIVVALQTRSDIVQCSEKRLRSNMFEFGLSHREMFELNFK
ncbi:hypothetical protein Bpfe_016340, partial [Biomphalaria pfeifferi]